MFHIKATGTLLINKVRFVFEKLSCYEGYSRRFGAVCGKTYFGVYGLLSQVYGTLWMCFNIFEQDRIPVTKVMCCQCHIEFSPATLGCWTKWTLRCCFFELLTRNAMWKLTAYRFVATRPETKLPERMAGSKVIEACNDIIEDLLVAQVCHRADMWELNKRPANRVL